MLSAQRAVRDLKLLAARRFGAKVWFGRWIAGGKTPEEVRKDIQVLNAQIATHLAKPSDKLPVMRHDLVLTEIAVLRALLQEALRDADAETTRVLHADIGWLDTFRENVHRHEIYCKHDASNDETARTENTLYTEYEQRKLTMMKNIETMVEGPSRRDVLKWAFAVGAGFMGRELYAQDVAKKDEQQGVVKTAYKALLTDEEETALEKKDSIDAIIKDTETIKNTKIERVTYDAEKKSNNYDALLQNGKGKYVVLFTSDKLDGNDKVLAKRAAIQLKAMAREMGNDVTFIYFDMDVDPALTEKNYTPFIEKFNVQSRCATALVRYDKDKKSADIVDIERGSALNSQGMVTLAKNNVEYWVKPNLLGKESPNGKSYKYKNTPKLQEVQ
ncbi:MAG TPA: hypothetical protein VLJ21_00340 [Candidatus Binatia bacterium]|nr:hypothetical protein [Candidatus Binatia bacterium]